MKKKALIFTMVAVLVAVSFVSAEAEEWSFFGSTEKISDVTGFSAKPFAATLSPQSKEAPDVFSEPGFSSFVPIQLDQLVVSLVNVAPDDNPLAAGKKPFFPQLHLDTGIKTQTSLTSPQSPLTGELFGDKTASFEATSSVIFLGVGIDFKSGFLKGNAFVGRPSATLTNRLFTTKPSDGVTNKGLNTDALGFEASAGYKLNDKIALGAGYGRMNDKNKETEQREEVYAVYAQAILAIAPGINVIPEVGQVERIKEEPASETETKDESFYAGARWEINF